MQQLMFLACPDGIVVADGEDKILMYTGSCEEIFSFPPIEVLGRNVSMLFTDDDAYADFKARAKTESSIANAEVLGVRKGGDTFPLAVSIGRLKDRYGSSLGTVMYFRDNTNMRAIQNALRDKNEKLNELVSELDHVASHDHLTGLLNRASALQAAERAMAAGIQTGRPLGVAVFDLDHFKHVNDTYGHLVGDDVLAALSLVLQNSARGDDIMGRFGGEEFVAFVPGADLDAVRGFAERVRESVAQAVIAAGLGTINVTISGGVASIPACADSLTEAIRVADDRLLLAKRSGRNRIIDRDELTRRTAAA